MKPRSAVLAIAIFAILAATLMPAVAAAPSVTIKLAHVNAVSHAINMSAEKFKSLVEQRSNGRIKVQVYPASQLGNEKEVAEGVKMGTIEMCSISSGMIATFYPPLGIFDAGYIFRDQGHQRAVLAGRLGQSYTKQLIEKAGINILQYYFQGARSLTTSSKPVYKAADLKGMKIRTPDVKGYMETIRAMGATPTPIAFNELFTALQLKVVDGQENPIPTIQAMKFYEVQKYCTLTAHMMAPGAIAINQRFFKKLSRKDQALIQKAALEAALYHGDLIVKQEAEALADLKAKGMTIITPTPEAMDEWRKMAAATLPKVFADVWEPGAFEEIGKVKSK